jgi:hypothetical protein
VGDKVLMFLGEIAETEGGDKVLMFLGQIAETKIDEK